MTGGSPAPVRYIVGLRLRRNGPLRWLDPGDLELEVGQRLVIATEDGERTARVAVGPTAAPPGMSVAALRVLRSADSSEDAGSAHVGAVEPAARHAPPSVSTARVARLINCLLAVRQRHPGASPTLVDLGRAFPDDDSEDAAGG